MRFLLLQCIIIGLIYSQEVQWANLVPKGYSANEIIKKYAKEITRIENSETLSEKDELFLEKIDIEFNNAPINDKLNNKLIKLAGFIVPLKQDKDIIIEFLLVQNLGACIHVPPPPLNQTIYVKTDKKHGININDIYNPVYVTGILRAKKQKTEMADTGYSMFDVITQPYQIDRFNKP